ncbi:DUF4097 family beta strand repeat-containing protein [Streptococcus infantis]|uniref:DUF4097 family beta strand repeat-containing protein n=1 Tax=Streptococcus infantis TaxID=68892 RepID=UPI001BDA38CF|nr:DUF4097 family beta strand repeat-containing protein [Streptococcus infantis]MBT0951903.1 DUF4097 family beta strand repeat protein [Streptococcus infantis]
MRKWTKGFLIFGVVTSIIGFSMMIIGIQTDGVRSLLAMSQKPVFESRMEELVFDQDIENLHMSLTEHSLVIRESSDDKIHIQYHPTFSEKENLQNSIKEKTLEISDTKSTTRRSVGSSIEGILFIASEFSSRNNEVVLSLPKGRELKNLTAQVDHGVLSIADVKVSNATIQSNGYLLRITNSEIKNSQLTTAGIVNVFETSLTDSRIQAEHQHISADDIKVHGKVELEARKDISLELSQKELERINVEFSAEHGDIYRWHRDRRDIHTGDSKGEALANPYKTEKKDTQDLLVAKSNQSIYFP